MQRESKLPLTPFQEQILAEVAGSKGLYATWPLLAPTSPQVCGALPPPPRVPADIDRMLDGSYAGQLSAKARARLAEQAGGDRPTEVQ